MSSNIFECIVTEEECKNEIYSYSFVVTHCTF
jgi:hypothetical protein